jgi:hypothetical protein
MAVLLGALVVGATGWFAVTEFERFQPIYHALPAADQDDVVGFLVSVLWLATLAALGVRFLFQRRAHPFVRPVLRALKDWGVLAAVGVFSVVTANWKLTLLCLAVTIVSVAAELIKAWRARRATQAGRSA